MEIRPYKKDDFDALVELSSHIWGGRDYLPRLINDFTENRRCFPYIMEQDGKLVAIANCHFFNDKWVWLEAMRTHPDYRRQGLATELTNFLLKYSKKAGANEAWLLTGTDNKATSKIVNRLDFEEVNLYNLWGFDENNDDKQINKVKNNLVDKMIKISDFEELATNDIKELCRNWKIIKSSREKSKVNNLLQKINENSDIPSLLVGEFMCFPISSYFLEKWIKERSVYILEEPAAVLTLRKSKEYPSSHYMGITAIDSRAVLSGIYLSYQLLKDENHVSVKDLDLNVFYPNQVEIPIIDTDWIFRLMKRKL